MGGFGGTVERRWVGKIQGELLGHTTEFRFSVPKHTRQLVYMLITLIDSSHRCYQIQWFTHIFFFCKALWPVCLSLCNEVSSFELGTPLVQAQHFCRSLNDVWQKQVSNGTLDTLKCFHKQNACNQQYFQCEKWLSWGDTAKQNKIMLATLSLKNDLRVNFLFVTMDDTNVLFFFSYVCLTNCAVWQ